MPLPELTPAELGGQLARLQMQVVADPLKTQVEVLGLLDVARQLASPQHEAQALMMLASCAFFQGQYAEMLGRAQAALPVSREARLSQIEARALNSMGLAYQRLGQLDKAMIYQAKAQGRNLALKFQPQMRTAERRRANLLYDLQNAVPRGELRLHYQAQFAVEGRRLAGAEALVRWQHPELGLLPPGHFIRLAEENRLIIELGDWVLQEACRQARAWDFGGRGLKLAVNVSALQFEQPDFVQKVAQALNTNDLKGPELVLELTESMVLSTEPRTARTLSELQALGVQVALDDFGAGFSSLGSLQKLHLDYLKIDRTFVEDLLHHAPQYPRARMLMDMMVNLAHNMNMVVVAEGVEQEEQLAVLAELNCDQVQGFLLARPVPPAELERVLGTSGR